MTVQSGDCYRCKRGALLYSATTKDGKKVGICYECREFVKKLIKTKKSS